MKLLLPGLVLVGLSACRTGVNYPDPEGPRYGGGDVAADGAAGETLPLRVISFNIQYSRRVEEALALLETEPALRDADIVLLQEMDAPSVRRIAGALGMEYVYYPAMYHVGQERDFGNAVLSRWPIAGDAKILLPYRALLTRTQRIATAATVCVTGVPLRVYSTHLGTIAEIRPDERRSQLRTVLADAEPWRHVIVGGDFNDEGVGELAEDAGYDWITRRGPRTAILGRWDHIVTRGLGSPARDATGTVTDNNDSSDHRPVWTLALLQTDGARDETRAGGICP